MIPRDSSAGIKDEVPCKQSHFYAAPIADETKLAPYLVTGIEKKEILYRTGFEPVGNSTAGFEIKSDWQAPFGLPGDGNNATEQPTLGSAFSVGCFMAPGKPDGVTELEATDIEFNSMGRSGRSAE